MTLQEFLIAKNVVVLDGAMGTELQRRGIVTALPLWSTHALLHAPHVVRIVHWEYLRAGADVLTTNTFRTNVRTLRRAGMEHRWEELNLKAVQLAFEARDRYPETRRIFIAASIAPVEECYAPHLVPPDEELEEEHTRQIRLLAMSGVDLLLIETMNTIREATIASRIAATTGKEWIVSFVCSNDGNILSGESLAEAVRAIEPLRPAMICVNCVSANHISGALRQLRSLTDIPLGAYANVGTPSADCGWELQHDASIDEYTDRALEWVAFGSRLVGGCCGTTPEYISKLNEKLRSIGARADTRDELSLHHDNHS